MSSYGSAEGSGSAPGRPGRGRARLPGGARPWARRLRGGGRPWPAFLLAGLALAAALAVAAVLALSSSSPAGAVTSSEPEIKRQLIERLHQHALYPHWVACVANGREFEGAAVIRCNVNYGDPHIEAICGVLRGGRLLTDHDEAAIPCGPDRRGWHPIVQTYG